MKFRVEPREAMLDFILPNSVGVEIGVHLGNYSERILKVVRPSMLHLVDPWKAFDEEKYDASWYSAKSTPQEEMDRRHASVQKRFENLPNVKIHRALSADAAREFANEYFDWVYVDGDHSYEGVTADIKAYTPKLKKGGLLIGDDYTLTGWWKRGVVDAFHDALASKAYFVGLKIGSQIALRKI